MPDDWRVIPEFDHYSVNSLGYIRNDESDRIMAQYPNTRGTAMIGFFKNGVQYKRAVAPIVAHAFLDAPPNDQATPINLDGDRFNNRATNLMWRPLWFARRYHRQFADPICVTRPIEDMDSGMQYATSRDAAVKHGLLDKEIRIGILNRIPVWPTFQFFRLMR